MADLPHPASATDELLVAVYGVLVDIRDRLPAPPPEPPSGQVELREPTAPDGPSAASGRAGAGSGPGVSSGRPARTARTKKTTTSTKEG